MSDKMQLPNVKLGKKEKEKLKNLGDQVIVTQFNVLRAQLLFSSFVAACALSGGRGARWMVKKKKEAFHAAQHLLEVRRGIDLG